MMKNKFKICLSIFTFLLLSACETIQIINDSQPLYENREIYFVGGGKCLQKREFYSNATIQPPVEYNTVDCKLIKGEKYIVKNVAYLSCSRDIDYPCNSGGEGRFYLKLEPDASVIITQEQLKSGELPYGFVDEQGASKYKQEIEAEKKAAELAKEQKEREILENLILQKKIISNFQKNGKALAQKVCRNTTPNTFEYYKCSNTLIHQLKREKTGQLESCSELQYLSLECQAMVSSIANLLIVTPKATKAQMEKLTAGFYAVGAECNCSMDKLFDRFYSQKNK
ncbi:MAG: hypothetical protein IJS26_04710 [Alphaproteobacteria bacterium]|nr:hypothetical protein [Alphaproteobacteria bacterium]